MHNSGVTTSSANHVSQHNTITKQIHIQAQPTTHTISNAQILDSMQISDVDVRISLHCHDWRGFFAICFLAVVPFSLLYNLTQFHSFPLPFFYSLVSNDFFTMIFFCVEDFFTFFFCCSILFFVSILII